MIGFLIFIIGLAITAVGANNFSKAAVKLSALLRLPRILIGATVVSLATTAPEMIVAVLSSVQKHSGLALGNALGSPIANLGLILGLVLLFGKVNFERNVYRVTVLLLVFSVLSYLIVFLQKTVNFFGGAVLVLLGIFYLWFLIKTFEDEKETSKNSERVGVFKKIIQAIPAFFRLLFGLGLILFGGFLVIQGSVNLAKFFNVSEIFIGLTLIAVGTSLPELALASASILKKTVAVSVGNLAGASILTLTLTLGVAATIAPVRTQPSVFFLDFPAVILMSLGFLAGQRLNLSSKSLGMFLLLFYLFYLFALNVVE